MSATIECQDKKTHLGRAQDADKEGVGGDGEEKVEREEDRVEVRGGGRGGAPGGKRLEVEGEDEEAGETVEMRW